jgi:RNA polymerase sigma factor (TIGR02999 family)
VTELLAELCGGKDGAYDEIFPIIYGQLRTLAAKQLHRERPGHTITPTVLVHEAYIKLADQSKATFSSRAHFLSVAALAMRRILINHASARSAQKRGGGERLFTFDDELVASGASASLAELLALDQLIHRLADVHERSSRVVVLRLFGGLNDGEIADVVGVSTPTVRRDWRFARAWLTKELSAR